VWRASVWLVALVLWVPAAAGQPEFDASTTPEDFVLRKVEQVHLDDVWAGAGGERVVELYVRALTRYGEPVPNLRTVDFEVRQDGDPVDTDDLSLATLEDSNRGITCVLAIDVSRTMAGEPFERAKEAASSFMDRLGARDRVAVVSFAGAAETVAPFDMPRKKAHVYLDALEIDPASLNTVLYDGVHKAVELIRRASDAPRRSLVIVFSDGEDGGSNHSLDQVIELAKGSSMQSQILVYTIGYARFGGAGLDALSRLAEGTGADFFQATSTAQLNAFYGEVLDQLMKSYVISFPATLDGEAHNLEVQAEGQKAIRTVAYPDVPEPVWPYVAFAGGAVVVAASLFGTARLRSPGRLVIVGGARAGESVRLRQGRLRIGALADNDLVIPTPAVSRYHAEVHVKGRQVEIEDLRSRNGTTVNDAAIKRRPIHPGDRIRIADTDLVFER